MPEYVEDLLQRWSTRATSINVDLLEFRVIDNTWPTYTIPGVSRPRAMHHFIYSCFLYTAGDWLVKIMPNGILGNPTDSTRVRSVEAFLEPEVPGESQLGPGLDTGYSVADFLFSSQHTVRIPWESTIDVLPIEIRVLPPPLNQERIAFRTRSGISGQTNGGANGSFRVYTKATQETQLFHLLAPPPKASWPWT